MDGKCCIFCSGLGHTTKSDGQNGLCYIVCATCFGSGKEKDYTGAPIVGTPEFLRET